MTKIKQCAFWCLLCLCSTTWGMGACTTPTQQETQPTESKRANQTEATPDDASPTPDIPAPDRPRPRDESNTTDNREPISQDETPSTPDALPEQTQDTTPETTAEQTGPDGPKGCVGLPKGNIDATWALLQRTTPQTTGMLVCQNNTILFERYEAPKKTGSYPFGGGVNKEYAMFSQTKSLSGLAALLLRKQKRIKFDDKVSKYITQWQGIANKEDITIRELLTLSSGIETKISLPWLIKLQDMLDAPFVKKQFAYGSQPFMVFSALLKQVTSIDAQAYLDRELFSKLNAKITIKRTLDRTRTPNLASGGQTTLRDMMRVGQELLDAYHNQGKVLHADDVKLLMQPGLNTSYGLSVWRNAGGKSATAGSTFPTAFPDCGDQGALHFLGAGGQVMTVVFAKKLLFLKSAVSGAVGAQSNENVWKTLFKGSRCLCQTP